jgi:PAS domain S-box-containing protein
MRADRDTSRNRSKCGVGGAGKMLNYYYPAEHANDVFFLCDVMGRRLHVSPSCHQVLRYEPDELASLPSYALVHPDDVGVVRHRYAKLSPECPEVSSIHRFRRKDGQYIWVEGLVRFVPPTTQTSALLIATVRDLTEWAHAEDALRESEQRFRGAFKSSAHGFALVSPGGRLLRVNAAFCRIIGYTELELLARDFQSITHPDDLAADLSDVRAMLAGEIDSFQREKRYLHKTGRIIEILLSVSLVHDSDGQPLHFVAQILDITERKRAEREASRLQVLLAEAIEAMQDGVVLFDSQDRLVLANTAVRRPYGRPDDIFVPGRAYEDVVRSYWAAADLTPEVLEQRVSVALERHRRGDGVAWEVQILPGAWQLMRHFRTRDGGIFTVSTDITGLKDKEAKLAAALTQAEAANTAKQDFLAATGHELRTPLNAIIGFSNIIADQTLGPLENAQYLDFANEIHQSGQQLLELIEAILEFSNADSADRKLVPVPVDIRTVARSALDAVAGRGDVGGIALEWAIPGELPLVVGDAARIRQILINLLTNGIKFTDRGGFVRLSVTTGDATIAITISDTGKGIAAEHLSRVFEPFYMVDGSLNRRMQDGVGLGLPLARRLVELSGGSLMLESELGVGTTATILLPSLKQ